MKDTLGVYKFKSKKDGSIMILSPVEDFAELLDHSARANAKNYPDLSYVLSGISQQIRAWAIMRANDLDEPADFPWDET